jgi:hypothetical protein
MITSSGSASSRIRGRSRVVPRTRTPSRISRRLSGSSSTKPTGLRPSSALRSSSRSTRRPPSPAPTIRTSRAPLRARKPRRRRSWMLRVAQARAAEEEQGEQEVEDDRAVGSLRPCRRVARSRRCDQQDRVEDQDPQQVLDVALRRVAPAALVDAGRASAARRCRPRPRERAIEQRFRSGVRRSAGRAEARTRGSTRARPDRHRPRAGAANGGGAGRSPNGAVGASVRL